MGNTQENSEDIARLKASVGEDAESGLRRDIKRVEETHEKIFDRLRAMELRGYMVAGGALVIIWWLERMA